MVCGNEGCSCRLQHGAFGSEGAPQRACLPVRCRVRDLLPLCVMCATVSSAAHNLPKWSGYRSCYRVLTASPPMARYCALAPAGTG
jgi:hypothetical protein